MWFISTSNPSTRIDCRTAILSAYAPDGGLLLPAEIPKIDQNELKNLAKLSYVKLLTNLLSRFLDSDQFSSEKLEQILEDVPEMFVSKGEMIPIRGIRLSNGFGVSVAELFHGPSLAFKDLATIPACRLMDACLSDEKKRGLVVISTSGDTGASVAGAVRGTKRIDALVLLPGEGRVAKIQERQTITWPDDNVHVFCGDASSDDLDLLAARLQEGSQFCDQNLLETAKKRGFLLTSLNSLNPVRVLAQLAPFFYVYLKTCPEADKKVCFVLPTGGGGNLAAGLLARRMGLPIEFVVALNANASIPHVIDYFARNQRGHYEVPASIRTLAPAMDMGFPYNFPRIAYLAAENHEKSGVNITADPATGKQHVAMNSEALAKVRSALFGVESATDVEIGQTMRLVAKENDGYTICPHTATAVSAALKCFAVKQSSEFAGVVAMATASPSKFVEALERADLLESNEEAKELLEKLNSLPVRSHSLEKRNSSDPIPYEDWLGAIKSHVEKTIFTKSD